MEEVANRPNIDRNLEKSRNHSILAKMGLESEIVLDVPRMSREAAKMAKRKSKSSPKPKSIVKRVGEVGIRVIAAKTGLQIHAIHNAITKPDTASPAIIARIEKALQQ